MPSTPLAFRAAIACIGCVVASPATAEAVDYPIGAFFLAYDESHPDQPPIEELLQTEVELGRAGGLYVAPSPGAERHRFPLAEVPPDPAPVFDASAVRHVAQTLVHALNERGLVGVFVAPDPADLDARTGEDHRPPGDDDLRLVVWLGRAQRVRTVALDESEDAIDRPEHARIARDSPVRPYVPGEERRDLMVKPALEDYVFRLNRHPRRAVQLSLSAGLDPGTVNLDYLVSTQRPWSAYAIASDTGTSATGKWRQHFGFNHFQLTGNDDILRLDYVTSGFDDVHAFLGSYEAPVPRVDWLRWRLDGGWNQYDATQVGATRDRFDGEQWELGLSLIANVFQYRELFVDVVAGARWQNVQVDNEIVDIDGDEDLFLPRLELSLERFTQTASVDAALAVEWSMSDLSGTSEDSLATLGRFPVDDDWATLQWSGNAAFYLEPLLDPEGWKDPSTPESSTLAHEVFLSTRGQHAFDYRLIPQHQRVAGGLHTVRGYPQSPIAGDTVVLTTVEYRFHLPHSLPMRREPVYVPVLPGGFRVSRQQVYGRPDWDLILRAFYDYGRVVQSDRESFENDANLHGVGLGVELQLWQKLRVRFDWGRALNTIDDGEVDFGNDEFHFLAGFVY